MSGYIPSTQNDVSSHLPRSEPKNRLDKRGRKFHFTTMEKTFIYFYWVYSSSLTINKVRTTVYPQSVVVDVSCL